MIAALLLLFAVIAIMGWKAAIDSCQPKPRSYCKWCGQDELQARLNRCGQKPDDGPCPMELR